MSNQPSSRVSAKRFTAGGAVLCAAMFAGPVLAEDEPDVLSDPFVITLGGFLVDTDTQVRVDGESGQGTPLDWENTFGGGDVNRFRVDGHWRFGDSDRHKMRFMWFNSTRSKSRTIDEEIEWNDAVYPVNAKVDSKISFDVYELAYEYALWHRDTWEVNVSGGLHYTKLAFELRAKAAESNGTLLFDVNRESDLKAPLPVIGLRGLWQLPADFYIDASAQYFALSIDEYDGSVTDLKLNVTWQPKPWLGIGLGYNQFNIDVGVNTSNFDGNLDWGYSGPMLFYSASF